MKKTILMTIALLVFGASGAMALPLSPEGGYALSSGGTISIYTANTAWYNISFSVTDMSGNNEIQIFDFDDNPGEYSTLSTATTPWLTDGFLLTFGVDTDHDGITDYTFSSDPKFNTEDGGIQHIYAEISNSYHTLAVGVEDELIVNNPDWDNGADLRVDFLAQCNGEFSQVNSVPEPATMFLFGTGLVGLAGYSQKKKNAQA